MTKQLEKNRVDLIIGKNIRNIRETRRLTRDEFAEMMGLTTSHIGLIERGERGATAVNLSKLSRLLDVPVNTFFADHDKEDEQPLEGQDLDAHANRLKIKNSIGSLSVQDLELVICLIKGMVKVNNSNS